LRTRTVLPCLGLRRGGFRAIVSSTAQPPDDCDDDDDQTEGYEDAAHARILDTFEPGVVRDEPASGHFIY
jgi:hypothetical protein